MNVPVQIISFGYLHAPAPSAHLVVDVREHFRDPHVSPGLRHMTAWDPEVTAAVLATPGVQLLAGAVLGAVAAFGAGPSPAPVTVAVGCAGGRHRSAVIAARLAAMLGAADADVTLTHRDIDRPVIERAPGGTP